MSTPANAEKERQKTLIREQRERDRLEKEKERLARIEKLQRAASQPGGAAAASRSAERDDDVDSDDMDAEEAAAHKKEQHQKIVQMWKDRKKVPRPNGVVRFKTGFRNTILDVFRGNGWKESESEVEWDIFWTGKEWVRAIYDKVHLEAHQRVNHFRNFYELTRKDLLIKNLKRAKRSLSKKGREEESAQFDFFPDTFSLPAEYSLFVEAFKKTPGISWIMKPIGSSQGKGIFLFERLSQISEWKNNYAGSWKPEDSKAEKYIVQRYLSDPLLIGGKKFDLRIYVLVTSYQPLTCYMYREGFARFSSTRFTMVKGDLTNNYVHLTNVAIQKKGDDYDAESGGKWDVIISDRHSFEMYGYDVLITQDLKPWLIEVNASPSLTANTPKDYQMKLALLQDTIAIVDMEKKLTGLEEQVGGYDLIYRGGFVKFNQHCTFTTYLGAHNNRDKQLKKLWKQIKKRKAEAAAMEAAQGAQTQAQSSPTTAQTQGSSGADKQQASGGQQQSNAR